MDKEGLKNKQSPWQSHTWDDGGPAEGYKGSREREVSGWVVVGRRQELLKPLEVGGIDTEQIAFLQSINSSAL